MSIVSKQELLDLFQSVYHTEERLSEERKELSEEFDLFAQGNELETKVVRQAYQYYKAFKKGKLSAEDGDYFQLSAIIENFFTKSDEDPEE